MNEDPDYIRAVSLNLSTTLDEIGLNSRTVKRRRDTLLYMENVDKTFNRICGRDHCSYFFGSQTEGTTTPGMDSDLDTLNSLNEYNVIQDWADWKKGKANLLVVQEDTAPGYCRLQLLRSDIPTTSHDVPDEHYTYDSNGWVIMTNTWLHVIQVPGFNLVRNGPAISNCGKPGIIDKDVVPALRCSSWPEQAIAFTMRERRYGWPGQRLIQQAVKQGVFLVPAGYKLSSTEHLEWRISASLAERCLMFSLSIVHIKCYVVMKMLIKTFLEPLVGKCISSYHCKTALLYCTENTEPGFWRDDNLLQCVTQCLLIVLGWVAEEFCPHFIIYEENLFAGKVTAQNKFMLQSVLTELVRSIGLKLLNVQMDDLGVKLQKRLSTNPSNIPVVDSLHTVTLLGRLYYVAHRHTHDTFGQILFLNKHATSSIVVHFVNQTIEMLTSRMRQSNKHELRAIQTAIAYLYRWLGSLLASIALSRKNKVPIYPTRLLLFGLKSDVASMLKLASVFLCNSNAHNAGTILHRVEHFYDRHEIQPLCGCYDQSFRMSSDFCLRLFALKGRKTRATRFATCVRFSPHEIHCAPLALQNELFRSVSDDEQHRHYIHDKWMDLAVVDCLPYLYYLQYITYRQLGQRDLQTRALSNLDRCIREDNNLSHSETAWNLLGQCLELEQQPEGAMACYRASLEIRPRNNAANWHISTLCYRLIRNG